MSRLRSSELALAALALISAALLFVPGRTVTTAYVNDLLIFLDGAHRIAWGQVPNRDFHTALGPLVYYLPALGRLLTGRLGGAMPAGMAVIVIAFAPLAIHVLGSRLQPALALLTGAFLILVLAVPANLGEDLSSLSFAMFYNRIGWAALALLLVMYLAPASLTRRQTALDALCATVLVLIQLYSKATYGVVALAFLGFMLLDRNGRRWAALAIALALVACGVVELFWHGTAAHIRDLLDTAKVSGSRDPAGIVQAALFNLPDIILFAVLASVALWRRFRLLDLAFYSIALVVGVLILTQNAHNWGIITLFGAGSVAAEVAAREHDLRGEAPRRGLWLGRGAPLLFLALVLPPTLRHAAAVLLHFGLAMSGFGQPLGLKALDEVRFGRLWSPGDNGFTELYISTFKSGADALAQLKMPVERVLDLDFISPFSAGLNLRPPEGDSSWLHWGRNISRENFLPPEQLFRDVETVMEPKVGINGAQLEQLYRPYLQQHFEVKLRTEQWTLLTRRPGEDAPQ